MIEKCISDTGDRGILFPELTREYCNCSHDLLFAQFTKSEYLKLLKKPFMEQVKETNHIFQDCLTSYEDKIKAQESEDWTEGEYQLMVEKCIQNSDENAVNHPKITRKYCECSRTKMIEGISKTEMAELIKKPIAEQNELVNPFVLDCLTEFEKALELVNK